jgi:hypothetical protein
LKLEFPRTLVRNVLVQFPANVTPVSCPDDQTNGNESIPSFKIFGEMYIHNNKIRPSGGITCGSASFSRSVQNIVKFLICAIRVSFAATL